MTVTFPNGKTTTSAEGLVWAKGCVGMGWGDIIDRLWHDIEALGWDGSLHQVKEKWGGLRFYIGGASDTIHNRIYEAEVESNSTCEWCGAPGRHTDGYWVLTLCDSCNIKRIEKINNASRA